MVMTIMAEVLWLSYNAFKLLLDVTASKDTLYRNGEEIACLWEPNPDNICLIASLEIHTQENMKETGLKGKGRDKKGNSTSERPTIVGLSMQF